MYSHPHRRQLRPLPPRLLPALTAQASRLSLSSHAFHNALLGRLAQAVTQLFGYYVARPFSGLSPLTGLRASFDLAAAAYAYVKQRQASSSTQDVFPTQDVLPRPPSSPSQLCCLTLRAPHPMSPQECCVALSSPRIKSRCPFPVSSIWSNVMGSSRPAGTVHSSPLQCTMFPLPYSPATPPVPPMPKIVHRSPKPVTVPKVAVTPPTSASDSILAFDNEEADHLAPVNGNLEDEDLFERQDEINIAFAKLMGMVMSMDVYHEALKDQTFGLKWDEFYVALDARLMADAYEHYVDWMDRQQTVASFLKRRLSSEEGAGATEGEDLVNTVTRRSKKHKP
ncbi:hypothetical protein DFH08DRAFT_1021682 [Mycena albidolilacea]|uniref:Uncharacterized protein n=1 Tax=Mycena albidolilacea TaxID=1033008 RepID=A0AAD7EJU8_9AGAR|nr:hypothetical protein DFH08DRAFT_1021682 [Mycena albidolilacea]